MFQLGVRPIPFEVSMRFDLHAGPPADLPCDLLALVSCSEYAKEPAVHALDARLEGVLLRAAADERFEGKPGQELVLHTHGKLGPRRIVLLGAGPRSELGAAEVRALGARAARAASAASAKTLGLVLGRVPGVPSAAQVALEGVRLGGYRFDRYRKVEAPPVSLEAALLLDPESSPASFAASAERARVVADAVAKARDLVNEPPGVLTPSRLADEARAIAELHGLEAKILGPEECESLGMGMLLAVGRASDQGVRFVHLTYRPEGRPLKKIGLIGKGLTFDSGGLSLKPTDGMMHMKIDMAGAAVVLATIGALAALRAPVEVHAIAPCAENMVSGSSYKLGDVLRGMGDKTVEITNTDAEGRLALADALTYAGRLELDELIDLATLTGACIVALGPRIAGVMSNTPALGERLVEAGKRAGEEMWPLPLPPHLRKQLESDVADLKNTGKREGGALTAGLFLQEFVREGMPWAHVDLAGPCWSDGDDGVKGGTGFGVASLVEHILGRPGA